MASPGVQRIVRTMAWVVLGWLVVGFVAGVVLMWTGVIEDDDVGTSVAATLAGLVGALVGGWIGWRRD